MSLSYRFNPRGEHNRRVQQAQAEINQVNAQTQMLQAHFYPEAS